MNGNDTDSNPAKSKWFLKFWSNIAASAENEKISYIFNK